MSPTLLYCFLDQNLRIIFLFLFCRLFLNLSPHFKGVFIVILVPILFLKQQEAPVCLLNRGKVQVASLCVCWFFWVQLTNLMHMQWIHNPKSEEDYLNHIEIQLLVIPQKVIIHEIGPLSLKIDKFEFFYQQALLLFALLLPSSARQLISTFQCHAGVVL